MLRAAIAVALLALGLVACGGDDDRDLSAGPRLDDPGPVHVHGLGVNPTDGALFIATHTGLFRTGQGEQTSERVGDRYQDTMGFTVVGRDHFLGSGHPDFQKDPNLPPLLGLIESKDGGKTWEQISLLGEADFHVLEADGRRVYGFDSSNGRLMVSSDGGRRWSRRPEPEPLLSLAVHTRNPERIVASGESGLHFSTDGGRRWRRLKGDAGLLAWPTADRLYLVNVGGELLLSRGVGERWREVSTVGGQPAAFEAEGTRDLYVALHDGTVKQSADGGRSWQVRSRP